MTRDDVRDLMYEYFDGHLSEEECLRVRSFLEEYEDVAGEYRQFHKILDKVKKLPTGIAAPDDLVSKISDSLLSISTAEYESRRLQKSTLQNSNSKGSGKEKTARISGRTLLLIIIAVVLSAVAAAFFFFNG